VRSIVILGAGELGGELARQLACADVAQQIVLVDEADKAAQGKALDINQAAPVDGYSTSVVGSSDESAVVGAEAIIVADRATSAVEWQGDAGQALVRRLAYLNQTAVIMCAGATHMDLVERGVGEMAISPRRLFGSAPEGLRSAVMSVTALEAACTPSDISLTVVGRPPDQIIVPWQDASIGGRRAVDVLTPPAITRLDARLPRLWPPGPLTLASAAARVVVAAATRRAQTLSLFVVRSRESVNRDRAGMLPVTVDAAGIAHLLTPTLSGRDRVRLETALQR
jgi:malate dehydrogenase